MAAESRLQPSLTEEEALWASGWRRVAGIDEVGRGPLAGPVVAAAVILDPSRLPAWVSDVRDSKELDAEERATLAEQIWPEALAVGLGSASVSEIDAWGIAHANRAAMARAIAAMSLKPQFVLVDGPKAPVLPYPRRAIVDGDAKCVSIAAASIVAKVARDQMMRELDVLYPGYGFARHKGYATPEHLARLMELGPCEQHRRSFLPVRKAGGLIEMGVQIRLEMMVSASR